MVEDAEKYKEVDTKRRECVEARNQYENTLYSAKNMLDGEEGKQIPEDKKTEIRSVIADGLSWLDKQGTDTDAEEYKTRMSDFQAKIREQGHAPTEKPKSDPEIVEVD